MATLQPGALSLSPAPGSHLSSQPLTVSPQPVSPPTHAPDALQTNNAGNPMQSTTTEKLSARNPIDFKESPGAGRYVVASTALPSNSTVLNATPYAFGIFDSHRKRVCGVCLAYNEDGPFTLHCQKCDQIYLCGAPCLRSLLASGHHVLCQPLRRLATLKAPQHEKSIIKILINTLFRRQHEHGRHLTLPGPSLLRDALNVNLEPSEAASLAPSPPTLVRMPSTSTFLATPNARRSRNRVQSHTSSLHDDDSVASDPDAEPPPTNFPSFLRPSASMSALLGIPPPPTTLSEPVNGIEGVQFDRPPPGSGADPFASNWDNLNSLQSHYADWPAQDVRDWRKSSLFLARILEECGLIEGADLGSAENGLPTGVQIQQNMGKFQEFVLHLISKIESNGFGLWTKKGLCMGRAVFPHASYFNHSCDPSCESIQERMMLIVRTKKAVEKDEELTISYIDTNLPVHARRQRLQDEYYFTCSCARCIAELSGAASRKTTYERSFNRKDKEARAAAIAEKRAASKPQRAAQSIEAGSETAGENPPLNSWHAASPTGWKLEAETGSESGNVLDSWEGSDEVGEGDEEEEGSSIVVSGEEEEGDEDGGLLRRRRRRFGNGGQRSGDELSEDGADDVKDGNSESSGPNMQEYNGGSPRRRRGGGAASKGKRRTGGGAEKPRAGGSVDSMLSVQNSHMSNYNPYASPLQNTSSGYVHNPYLDNRRRGGVQRHSSAINMRSTTPAIQRTSPSPMLAPNQSRSPLPPTQQQQQIRRNPNTARSPKRHSSSGAMTMGSPPAFVQMHNGFAPVMQGNFVPHQQQQLQPTSFGDFKARVNVRPLQGGGFGQQFGGQPPRI